MNKKELEGKIKELLKIESLPMTIKRQITRFVTELGYNYEDIYQALYFFIEIKKGNYESKYGIGIIPYIKEESDVYYKRKREEEKKQVESVQKSKSDIILKVNKVRKKKKVEKIE